ncbi:helix-turn-helix domain-containing protein [Lacticaseibacillus pabuli]|uniref:Helix-turn-helix domain-containing protein n=1 Tax=Lacticaseibacillus pabuli TaxID=3025672 RepID=A0ABY7WPL4_9LACO|nr:helix-turn-helix domain-containing protein [Lacticaseibacillus sp. KACC 23028]WDF82051.1 helix-turn-helix domain-containing protein [Lacticaseibacillus sp. KACC 23028]
MNQNYLTSSEAAKYMGVSESTLFIWYRYHDLPRFQIGNVIKYQRTALDEFLDKYTEAYEDRKNWSKW